MQITDHHQRAVDGSGKRCVGGRCRFGHDFSLMMRVVSVPEVKRDADGSSPCKMPSSCPKFRKFLARWKISM